jgi:MFS family permease
LRPAATTPAPPGRGYWPIVALLAAALFINYVDRGAVPTAAPLIQDELGLSPRQLGLLFSAFFWSYALLQVPVGWLAERIGAQRVLACGLAIWACATLLVGVAHSFAMLLGLRVLLGIGESAGFPCVSKLLAVAVPVGSLGGANGIVAFAYMLGPAVGSYCGGLLMVHFGWRAAFWAFGALSLLWLLPWSRVRLPRAAATASGTAGPTLPALLRQRSLWGTSLGLFSTNYAFYFMLTWLPYIVMRDRGFSIAAMAALTGGAYVVNARCAPATRTSPTRASWRPHMPAPWPACCASRSHRRRGRSAPSSPTSSSPACPHPVPSPCRRSWPARARPHAGSGSRTASATSPA